MGKNKKKPKTEFGGTLRTEKTPNVASPPSLTGKPSWRLGFADDGGLWPLLGIEGNHAVEVVQKLGQLETMNWTQIAAGTKSHFSGEGICKDAQCRLAEKKLDQWSSHLFSIRLKGTWRLWGFLIGDVFHILWWDPEHSVYPSQLKHT